MKLPQLNHILVLLVKILLVKSHYWPNGYNRVSRDHTWSTSPVSSYSSSRRSQYQYQAPQQLYQQPQQLYQQPQQLYSSPVVQQQQPTVSRSWSQPRNSVLKRGWPVKGRFKLWGKILGKNNSFLRTLCFKQNLFFSMSFLNYKNFLH